LPLLIVRHGECEGQVESSFTTADSALTLLGERQAQATAERLAGEGITHIVSSPLIRCLSTATAIAAALPGVPAVLIEVWMDLREGYSGMHQGYGRTELQQRFPCALLPESLGDEGWIHGNDTYESLNARCERVLQQLREQFSPSDTVVMVTHGGFGNYLLHAILRISTARPIWFEMANCSISRVRFVADPVKERPNWPLYPPVQAEVLSLNDQAHLETLER